MKRTILTTHDQLQQFATRLNLPRISTIKTTGDLFRALDVRNTPDAQSAAIMLREVLKQQANIIDTHQLMLNELPAPAKPLKGRNSDRYNYYGDPCIVIPASHRDQLTTRLSPRAWKTDDIISPEAHEILLQYRHKIFLTEKYFQAWKTTTEHSEAQKRTKEIVSKLEREREELLNTEEITSALMRWVIQVRNGAAPFYAAIKMEPEADGQLIDDKRRELGMNWSEFSQHVQKILALPEPILTEHPVNPAI